MSLIILEPVRKRSIVSIDQYRPSLSHRSVWCSMTSLKGGMREAQFSWRIAAPCSYNSDQIRSNSASDVNKTKFLKIKTKTTGSKQRHFAYLTFKYPGKWTPLLISAVVEIKVYSAFHPSGAHKWSSHMGLADRKVCECNQGVEDHFFFPCTRYKDTLKQLLRNLCKKSWTDAGCNKRIATLVCYSSFGSVLLGRLEFRTKSRHSVRNVRLYHTDETSIDSNRIRSMKNTKKMYSQWIDFTTMTMRWGPTPSKGIQ